MSRSYQGQISTLGGIFSPISAMHERILMKLITIIQYHVNINLMALWRLRVQRSRSQTTFPRWGHWSMVHRPRRSSFNYFWVLLFRRFICRLLLLSFEYMLNCMSYRVVYSTQYTMSKSYKSNLHSRTYESYYIRTLHHLTMMKSNSSLPMILVHRSSGTCTEWQAVSQSVSRWN